MFTLEEIELLASLLARAGITRIEAMWANALMNRLRAQVNYVKQGGVV